MRKRSLKNRASIAVTVKNLESTHTHLNQMVKASIKGTREITVMVPAEMAVTRSLKMGSLAMMWKSANNIWQRSLISEFREMESGDRKSKCWELINF